MFIRAYLRASTVEQDATRAREDLRAFAKERGWTIAATYVENESGAILRRPELMRLLGDCQPGDVLLVEQIDRLSRLSEEDWDTLRREIKERHVRLVALDLPTTWMMADPNADELQRRIFDAIHTMMVEMMAALARKDYVSRRHRQQQGIAKAKERGAYRGRPENTDRNASILQMLKNGQSWDSIVKGTGCSRSTLARLRKRLEEAAE